MAKLMQIRMVSGERHEFPLDESVRDKPCEECADEWFESVRLGELVTLKFGNCIMVVRNIESIVFL